MASFVVKWRIDWHDARLHSPLLYLHPGSDDVRSNGVRLFWRRGDSRVWGGGWYTTKPKSDRNDDRSICTLVNFDVKISSNLNFVFQFCLWCTVVSPPSWSEWLDWKVSVVSSKVDFILTLITVTSSRFAVPPPPLRALCPRFVYHDTSFWDKRILKWRPNGQCQLLPATCFCSSSNDKRSEDRLKGGGGTSRCFVKCTHFSKPVVFHSHTAK